MLEPDHVIQSMRTANYADYSLFSKHDAVTCGWMDFHSDYDYGGATKDEPMFTIKVLWVNKIDKPILVHSTDRITFEGITPEVDQIITFNAVNIHALVPRDVWYSLPKKYSENRRTLFFKRMKNIAEIRTSPKLVWKFIEGA